MFHIVYIPVLRTPCVRNVSVLLDVGHCVRTAGSVFGFAHGLSCKLESWRRQGENPERIWVESSVKGSTCLPNVGKVLLFQHRPNSSRTIIQYIFFVGTNTILGYTRATCACGVWPCNGVHPDAEQMQHLHGTHTDWQTVHVIPCQLCHPHHAYHSWHTRPERPQQPYLQCLPKLPT